MKSVRISDDAYAFAKQEAALMSRSMAQQFEMNDCQQREQMSKLWRTELASKHT